MVSNLHPRRMGNGPHGKSLVVRELTMYSKVNPETNEQDYYFAMFLARKRQTGRLYAIAEECTFRHGDYRINILKYYDGKDYGKEVDAPEIVETTFFDTKEDAIAAFFNFYQFPDMMILLTDIL